MKRIFLVLLLALPLVAQQVGPVSITSTQCATISVDQKASVGIQVVGTWSGTLQPQVSVGGQPRQNAQVIPPDSSTAQSTITTNGAYVARVSGYQSFALCGDTVGSGTANVYLNASPALH